MKLEANLVHIHEKDGVLSVAFRGGATSMDRYLILSRTTYLDEQDIALGLDGVHIEIGGQNCSGYKAVSAIEFMEFGLQVSIIGGILEGFPSNTEIAVHGSKVLSNLPDLRVACARLLRSV